MAKCLLRLTSSALWVRLPVRLLRSVDAERGRISVRGLDLIDGTPILDVKPYLPYCDAFPEARSGWLDELDGGRSGDHANEPDRLDYWPPPKHLL